MNQQETDPGKRSASENLIKVADQMELHEPGSVAYKQLQQEYKFLLNIINEDKDPERFAATPERIQKSKEECFAKIKEALSSLGKWKREIKKKYIGEQGHIAFAYVGNYKGMEVEVQLCFVDSVYSSYSGYVAVKNYANLVFLKQLKGYTGHEQALLSFAVDMLSKSEQKSFFDQYIKPYNKKVERWKRNTKIAGYETRKQQRKN